MIFARKINKIKEFYNIFVLKMPEFYRIIARIFFPIFFFGGGARALPASPSPTPEISCVGLRILLRTPSYKRTPPNNKILYKSLMG